MNSPDSLVEKLKARHFAGANIYWTGAINACIEDVREHEAKRDKQGSDVELVELLEAAKKQLAWAQNPTGQATFDYCIALAAMRDASTRKDDGSIACIAETPFRAPATDFPDNCFPSCKLDAGHKGACSTTPARRSEWSVVDEEEFVSLYTNKTWARSTFKFLERDGLKITKATMRESVGIDTEIMAFRLFEYDKIEGLVTDAWTWPEHKDDDGYRGDGGYVTMPPSDIQHRYRERAKYAARYLRPQRNQIEGMES